MNNTSLSALEVGRNMLAHRHSHYALTPEWVVPQSEVENLLATVLQQVPSAFNAQPVRIALLTGEAHQAHWQLIEDTLISYMGKEEYEKSTAEKINGAFRSGVATVLFFDDPAVTKGLEEAFPPYAHNMAPWAMQAQGSHQFAAWVGLDALGFGVSLQHYIGMVDDRIKEIAGVDPSWTLIGQMPFGRPVYTPEAKEKLPLSTTLIVK